MKEANTHGNLTSVSFWNEKYAKSVTRYSIYDPYYGKKGLLARVVLPLIKEAENILELGCGSSRYMMFFKIVAGLDTYGIDFSSDGLRKLERMSLRYGVKHHIYQGDIFAEDFGGKKFDVVFHSGLVEHFRELKDFFLRCRFFCHENGLMIFLIPNMQNLAWKWHGTVCPVNNAAHYKYTPQEIVNSLTKSFSVLAAKPWGYIQIYAGGPPETPVAKILKWVNLLLVGFTHLWLRKYKGIVSDHLASSWLFVCRAR